MKMYEFQHIKQHLEESMLDIEPIIVPFGVLSGITFPLFYFINKYLLLSPNYPNMFLRVLISVLCFILAFKNYWPKNIKIYLVWVWYGTIFVSMPFFGTFMLLTNHFSAAWCLNFIAILTLMILLMNWIIYTILFSLGILFGLLMYYFTTHSLTLIINPTVLTPLDFISTGIVSMLMGVVFSQKKRLVEQAKLQTVKAIGTNIAHELRTPLASIRAGVVGVKRYLPILLESYMAANKASISTGDIPSIHLNTLLTLCNELEEEIKYSNIIIDMLLIKSKQNGFQQGELEVCSIEHCIKEAIHRYPFKEGERALIHWNNHNSFEFRGESLLVLHIFFNLIKNALYFIERARKGIITIWYEDHPEYNLVHFKDTSAGIPEQVMLKLFQKFYTHATHKGTGLGLAFCKMVMQGLKGDIKCQSQCGEFTKFTLQFPKVMES